jgi:hypothetical protein
MPLQNNYLLDGILVLGGAVAVFLCSSLKFQVFWMSRHERQSPAAPGKAADFIFPLILSGIICYGVISRHVSWGRRGSAGLSITRCTM